MRLGIDFGTSNCAAAAVIDGQVVAVDFDGARQFRTTVWFPDVMRDADQFELDEAMAAQVDALVDGFTRDARAAGRNRTLQAMRSEAIRIVRREWMESRMREPASSTTLLHNAVYGDAALDAYFIEEEGNLVQSPKSMLGYQLHPRARQTIAGIAAHILEHIRLTASRQFGRPVRTAVLGRPVQFRSSIGEAGNEQALSILREAAAQAGFDAVEFLEEPAAAAMAHHAASSSRHEVVVVDIGGGTTDIAHASVGGAQPPQVHRAWGIARGGTDIDLALSLAGYMPLFGRGITRVPNHHYVEAAMVQDMPRQREFRTHKYDGVDAPYGPRLEALQEAGNTSRLYREVEGCKIALSSTAEHHSALGFIEKALSVATAAPQLDEAAGGYLRELNTLLTQVRQDIGHDPAVVFVTGGMSRAPYLRAAAAAAFPGAELVIGDASFGVVAGLAHAAAGPGPG
ncbi:MAG: Hsp70 family protein [Stenotrophomonas sp.]